ASPSPAVGCLLRGWSRCMTLDVEAVPASVRSSRAGEDGPPAAVDRIEHVVTEACAGLAGVSADKILTEARRAFYPGVVVSEVELAFILAARSVVEVGRVCSYVAARLLLDKLRREALTFIGDGLTVAGQSWIADHLPAFLAAYVSRVIALVRP